MQLGDPARERAAVRALLRRRTIAPFYQPIVRFGPDEIVGYEALARIPVAPHRGPDLWLRAAASVGLRAELEIACLEVAVEHELPPDDGLLFLNISPSLVAHPTVVALLEPIAPRVVLELSEQEEVHDFKLLDGQLDAWREIGGRVAIDDTGSGYASLQHVIRLRPDYIKLDRALVEVLDDDSAVRRLVASFVEFAADSGAQVLAEGIETSEQLSVLRATGVHLGQGYLLGRPQATWATPVTSGRGLRVEGAANAEDLGEVVCAHLASLDVMPSLYLERDGLLRCVAQRGLWQVLDGLAPGAGITGQAYANNELVFIPDVRSSEGYLEAIPGVVAEACVPLRAFNTVVGALNIDSTHPLTEAHVAELVRVGQAASDQLEAIGFRQDIDPMARLVASAVRLDTAANDDEVVEIVLDAAVDISGLSTAVLLTNAADGEAANAVVRGPLQERLRSVGSGIFSRVLADAVPWRSCYTAGEERAVGMVGTDALRALGIRTVVAVPIRPTAAPASLLAVMSTQRIQLKTNKIELLELLAGQAAARLEVLAHVRSLHQLAQEDPLTGLGNRAAFNGMAQAWRDDGSSGVLALLDIDRFKHINDTFGHGEGDLALQQFSRALETKIRPGDGVFRLGGDEFALLLRDARIEDISWLRDKVMAAAESVLTPRGAWISMGTSVLFPGTNVESALRNADVALYAAKALELSDETRSFSRT
jgi:diguanylate cyclase (GGDEF)-like protein